MISPWCSIGALLAGLGVAAGAFGAHGLKGLVPAELLTSWETACRYQIYHALMLVILGLLGERLPAKVVSQAGILFALGILLFSGSLYLMTLTGFRLLGAVTPLGGVAFLAGWALLSVKTWPRHGNSQG